MPRPKLDGKGGEVVKRVRLTREQAGRLGTLAHALGVTESDVLRRGVDLVAREQERERALEVLVSMADEDRHYLQSRAWRSGGFR